MTMEKIDSLVPTYQHYSFFISENYCSEINSTLDNILNKYHLLVVDYIKFIVENLTIKKNEQYYKYIIIRGLETIHHVFTHVLQYSKNIDMAYYHGQKAYFFFVEFITQISSDSHSFLHLTTKDAILFVYKKTIYDLQPSFSKGTRSNDDREKLDQVEATGLFIKQVLQYGIIFSDYALLPGHVDSIFETNRESTKDLNKITSFIETIYSETSGSSQEYFCKLRQVLQNF
jgi:hypothetical protein